MSGPLCKIVFLTKKNLTLWLDSHLNKTNLNILGELGFFLGESELEKLGTLDARNHEN